VGKAFKASIETRRLGRKNWLLWPKSASSFSTKPFKLVFGPVYLAANLFLSTALQFSFGFVHILTSSLSS